MQLTWKNSAFVIRRSSVQVPTLCTGTNTVWAPIEQALIEPDSCGDEARTLRPPLRAGPCPCLAKGTRLEQVCRCITRLARSDDRMQLDRVGQVERTLELERVLDIDTQHRPNDGAGTHAS